MSDKRVSEMTDEEIRAMAGAAAFLEWTHFVIGETAGEFAVRAACTNEQDAVDAASMSAAEFDQVHVAAIVATPKEAQGSR